MVMIVVYSHVVLLTLHWRQIYDTIKTPTAQRDLVRVHRKIHMVAGMEQLPIIVRAALTGSVNLLRLVITPTRCDAMHTMSVQAITF
jgi:hypothetical protein